MNILRRIYQRSPRRVQDLARRLDPSAELEHLIAPHLVPVTCIDVGASYYPHTRWRLFLESPQTTWVAVEPNGTNLEYVSSWRWPARVVTCTVGLSQHGGTQTLFVTNVDSGSSLLEPEVGTSMQHRFSDLDYFFPITEVEITTRTLASVIDEHARDVPVIVKLDTQGTELAILTGAFDSLEPGHIVGIETEASMLAEPVMRGSSRFWEVCRDLESRGYELLQIRPIEGASLLGVRRPKGRHFLNECDAVFGLRQDVAAAQPVAQRVALFAFYTTYALREEAVALLDADGGLRSALRQRGADVEVVRSKLVSLA